MKIPLYVCLTLSAPMALLCCNQVVAAPSTTEAHIEDTADNATYSYSDPSSVSLNLANDNADTTWIAFSSASASSAFFDTHASVDTKVIWALSLGNPPSGPGSASGSFNLSWANNGQSGNLLTIPNLGNGLAGQQSAIFQFVYGTPYTIQGLLSLNSSSSGEAYSSALAKSLWSDTFTFHGGADGTHGTATFNLNINGSLSEASGVGAPMRWGDGSLQPDYYLSADENFDVTLSSVSLPAGTWVVDASGAPLSVPDGGSSASLMAISLGALGFCLNALARKRSGA